MNPLAQNFERIQERIAKAAASAGRRGSDVRLLAVSKGQPVEMIREAYALGQRRFGENYAQELALKAASLVDCNEIEWHFIGHLQSNKAKVVAPIVGVVHTVDTPSLAKELGRRAAKTGRPPVSVLIEVNVGGERQKHGVMPSEIQEIIDAILCEPALELRGLMTVPPAFDPAAAKGAFETLASLRSLHGGWDRLPELSMGMSDDLELAVAAGATMVRVGTGIFGPRHSKAG